MHDVENTDNIYNLSPNDSDKQTNLTCSASVSSMDIFDHSQDIELEEEENERSDTETILNRNNEQVNIKCFYLVKNIL